MEQKNLERTVFCHRCKVFIITFLLYAAVHSCSSVWSYSKDSLHKDPNFSFTTSFFGTCDMAFLLCYSLSFYLFGWIGDRIDLRIFLSVGLLGICCSFGSMGLMRYFEYHNEPLFAFFMALNGVFQSVGWPGCVAIMANWFGAHKRGMIMAIWSGTGNIGNAIGYEFGAIAIDFMNLSFDYAIFCAVAFLFITCLLLVIFVKPYPEAIGIKIANKEDEAVKEIEIQSENYKPLGFFRAWTLPGVAIYTLGYTCIKATSYGILFWLAIYLKSNNLEYHSSMIAQLNDIAQYIGGLCLGLLNDRYKRKALFMPPFLLLAAIFFILVKYATFGNVGAYYILMFCCGFTMGGPFNIISSAIAADLGKNPSIKGDKRALATVAGIIEGTGSLGAALIQKFIPYIQNGLFLLLAGLCFLGGVIVTPTAYHEYVRKKEKEEILMRKESGDSTRIRKGSGKTTEIIQLKIEEKETQNLNYYHKI